MRRPWPALGRSATGEKKNSGNKNKSTRHNNNNIYLLQLGCHPVAVGHPVEDFNDKLANKYLFFNINNNMCVCVYVCACVICSDSVDASKKRNGERHFITVYSKTTQINNPTTQRHVETTLRICHVIYDRVRRYFPRLF